MIKPPDFRGAAFTTAVDGDMREGDRTIASDVLDIPGEWATVRQVHAADIVDATGPGDHGEADGLVTNVNGVPLAVMTADCGGVVLEAPSAVAVVHSGWRGAARRVVERAAFQLSDHGGVERAALGPTIGPCCFEVGPEVAAEFPDYQASTSWGTTSVDLRAAIRDQVPGAKWWTAPDCTRCGGDSYSHRRDGAPHRMAAIGWLP